MINGGNNLTSPYTFKVNRNNVSPGSYFQHEGDVNDTFQSITSLVEKPQNHYYKITITHSVEAFFETLYVIPSKKNKR